MDAGRQAYMDVLAACPGQTYQDQAAASNTPRNNQYANHFTIAASNKRRQFAQFVRCCAQR